MSLTITRPSVFVSSQKSIYKNLSFERYFYKNKALSHPILLFYQNQKSIIIGRNQNAWKECKLEELEKREVDLCRRFSGGGAVYQDLGWVTRQYMLLVHHANF